MADLPFASGPDQDKQGPGKAIPKSRSKLPSQYFAIKYFLLNFVKIIKMWTNLCFKIPCGCILVKNDFICTQR